MACLLVHGVQGYNPSRGVEIPPLIITHNEIHDVDGTFFVTFNELMQCTMDYTDHVLHACTHRDTMTDSVLVATAILQRLPSGCALPQ